MCGAQKRLLAWLIPDFSGVFCIIFRVRRGFRGRGVYYAVALCGDVAIRHLHTPRYARGDIMPWRKAAAAGQSRVFSTRVNRALCCYIPHCGRSGASFNINAFVTDKLSLSWDISRLGPCIQPYCPCKPLVFHCAVNFAPYRARMSAAMRIKANNIYKFR